MKIVKAQTSDGIIFSGILVEPKQKTKTIIIHIHGMSGDIYSNSYYPYMYKGYPKAGISFLAAEHRGTHSITQFNTTEGTMINIGNTYEIFEDSIMDIKAWIDTAKELGYKEIWLQAHSLGPSKTAYYTSKKPDKAVKGLVFISPADMIGLVFDPEGYKDHEILLPKAKELISQDKGEQILEHDLWGSVRLSANTYVNFFGEGTNTAVFNYAKPELGWEVVNSIDIPTIAFTGTNDDGITPVIDAHKAMEILERELKNCPKKKTVVFEGGDHDFKGFGDKIVDEVIDFISNI